MATGSILDRPRLISEGAKPSDGVPDMTIISDIDEHGINTNLKVRYELDRIYTYTGSILVAVNPYKQLAIYDESTIRSYSGRKMADMPPHAFSTAESALYFLENDRKNQSCVISGESGAGKTETTKFILQYLCTVTCSVARWTEQQILEANTVLEAFGNAKTVRNDNSSRFGKFIQVCFDSKMQISGSVIQDYLLEQSRISFQAIDERNYHIFYQLTAACMANPELKKQFLMESPKTFHYLNQSGCYQLEGVDDASMFDQLRLAMQVLNIDEETSNGIFQVVAAILWIGNLEFQDTDKEAAALKPRDKEILKRISHLLGIPVEKMAHIALFRQITVKGTTTDIDLKYHEACDNRHAMAKALYSRTFTWLVQQINTCTNPGIDQSRFIGVLDIFGFENFKVNSFEQLCINYTNEKLHKFFNHYVFAIEQAIYAEEGIQYSHITFTDNTVCLELIEKAPKCVLKLLDEECRFPKGTDQSYLEKQHQELSSHPHYIKSADKRRWGVEFGVRHYAGPVMYQVSQVLEKNKDVQQDILFDAMDKSTVPFVRALTKFRDMLDVTLEAARKRTKSKALLSGTKTGKGRPTVADTFRTQLVALVDVLDTTTPWYVRCLKPNELKKPDMYVDDLIITQLRYSGMLDIIRIRKEGYPVHVKAKDFLSKYSCLAAKDPNPLPSDPKQAVASILRSLSLPVTEWQIGKTKVFLRNTVFDPLEERRKELLAEKVIVLQRYFRGFVLRRKYRAYKKAAVIIQKNFRGTKQRRLYVKMRRSAIIIQAHVRGMFGREIAAVLREKKRLEEEERERQRQLELKKQQEERDRVAREESMKAAQKELLTLARVADYKSRNTTTSSGEVDLDKMFLFLKEDVKASTPADSSFFAGITSEIDRMFAASEKEQQKTKPARKAPPVPKDASDRLSRTQRRHRRVQKKLVGMEEDQTRKDDKFDPNAFPLFKYAKSHFNDFPKDTSGFSTLTLRRARGVKDPIPKADMLLFTKNSSLPTSMVHMHDPDNVNLACSIFKDLCKLLKGDFKPDQANLTIQSTIAYGIERPELRDEIFCQLIRQITNNPKEEGTIAGWHFLTLCVIAFPPSKAFRNYLQAYVTKMTSDAVAGQFAQYCLNNLRLRISPRRLPPSSTEIAAVRNLHPLICRFYFLDGKAKAIGVDPSATASDVIKALAEKIELQNVDGWALFEVDPDKEHFVRSHEYIADILAQWERDKRTSMMMTRYTTVSRRASYTQAMGAGDARFVVKKRIFRNPKEIPEDPVEYHLMYAQAVHSVVKIDEFPVNEGVALQLAGLQAQVLFGEYDSSRMSRYEEIEQFLPERIIKTNRSRTRDQWMKAIAHAHEEYGTGKSAIQAKVWYMTSVKHYPLYGSSFFSVEYKGFWSHPNHLFLAVDVTGVKFVNKNTKQIMAEYPYAKLEVVAVDMIDDAIKLTMKTATQEEQKLFVFETIQKEDIANLIASYSPVHSNWQRVGESKTKMYRVTEEDRAKHWQDIWQCRKALVEHKMLRRPPDTSGGFLTTTLRRYNRAKMEALQRQREENFMKDFDKVFKQSYWSYSKSMLKQPLSMMEEPEVEEVALKMFHSLLLHAGIAAGSGGSGFEMDQDDAITLVQLVISKCLDREILCNELYLQLIKQTTDQPDPNGRINISNWRFMSLILGVVVPRNKVILAYLHAHLKRCSLEAHTEEGKFAQYCMQTLQRTLDAKNRKYPPSRQEAICVVNRRPIHARFYFMDGQFRALEFNPSATTEEVIQMVKERIGLRRDASGYSLFEVFGTLERNMLPNEKVADAMFKWEKYARTTNSPKTLKLTFKKRLFLKPFFNPQDPVERNLMLHQAIQDVVGDRFPVTYEEATYLTALRAHRVLGPYSDTTDLLDYTGIIEQYIPRHMRAKVQPEDIRRRHRELLHLNMNERDAEEAFMGFVRQWRLYGATVFDVVQGYTAMLPKNLWLAVDEHGIHILKRRDKEPIVTYDYKDIVNYSPSLKNLMIVTESLTRGTKFVFNTSQASQIAHLIRDYTHIIVQRQRRSSLKSGK